MRAHKPRAKIFLNKKGVFITLTAFLLALLLIASAANMQKTRTIEENSISLAIAGERTYFVKENFLDIIRSAYSASGINWATQDNNFIYTEDFPNSTAKIKIGQNLSSLKSFLYKEFPNNPDFYPENTDLGKIILYGKDFNILHSQTTGFGANQNLYFHTSQGLKNISEAFFDLNVLAASVSTPIVNFPLCISCTNPMKLTIKVSNGAGTLVYSFSNTIDLSQAGTLDINTNNSSSDIRMNYSFFDVNWSIASTNTLFYSKFTFNDPLFEAGLGKNILQIKEMQQFGFTG